MPSLPPKLRRCLRRRTNRSASIVAATEVLLEPSWNISGVTPKARLLQVEHGEMGGVVFRTVTTHFN